MTITSGIQHTGGPKFSEIRDSFANARDDQHINFSTRQGLHTDPKLEASSAFVESFRSQAELDARATLREAAIQKIKDALDEEYGPGVGQKVFDDVSKGAVVELTKKDLDHLDSAAKRLRADHEMPANDRLGAVTIERVYKTADDATTGLLADRKNLTEADENAARARMRDAVLLQPQNASVDQCLRAAQQALLEFDLEREIAECFKDKPGAESQRAMLSEKLSTHLTNLRVGPWRGIPLAVAAPSLRQFCMTGGSGDACQAHLEAQSATWPPPKVSWSLAQPAKIGERRANQPEANPPPGDMPGEERAGTTAPVTRTRSASVQEGRVPVEPQSHAWTRAVRSSSPEPAAAGTRPASTTPRAQEGATTGTPHVSEPASRETRSQTFSSSEPSATGQTKERSASDATELRSREAAARRAAALKTLELQADASDEEIWKAYRQINSSLAAASLDTTLPGDVLTLYAKKKEALREVWDVVLSKLSATGEPGEVHE